MRGIYQYISVARACQTQMLMRQIHAVYHDSTDKITWWAHLGRIWIEANRRGLAKDLTDIIAI